MKLKVFNRDPDGQPLLRITATTKEERLQLEILEDALHDVQLRGIQMGKAGKYHPCGSESTIGDGTRELVIEISLGSPEESDKLQIIKRKIEEIQRIL
jgi:hypothetical protein